MTVQLDQSSRRLNQLEEEKRSTEQSLKRSQGLLDELKGRTVHTDQRDSGKSTFYSPVFIFVAKSEVQAEELKRIQSKLEQQTQTSGLELQNMKKTLDDAENKNQR